MRALLLLLLLTSPLLHAQTYFPPTDGGEWETIDPSTLDWCPEKIDTLLSYLEARNTKAFMILKDGRIAIEAYFDAHTQNTLWYWASAGKTITATLVGKALEDGQLELDDPLSEYIGTGWTSCDSIDEAERTIWHALTMTSSFSNSIFYWDCTEPECYQCTGLNPGEQWHYHNGVYRRLLEVVEVATGLNRNAYTDEVLESVTGMSGFWAENLYISQHRDMARFGWLALNGFVWDGVPVLNEAEYIESMTSPSQALNPSYGYLWWLNGQDGFYLPLNFNFNEGWLVPSAPGDMYMALGANDQKVYVVPSEGLVVTRQGDEAYEFTPASSSFDTELWELISDLGCEPLSTREEMMEKLRIHPNPTEGGIDLPLQEGFSSFAIYSTSGQLIIEGLPGEYLPLPPGIYLVEARNDEGFRQTQRLVVY
jgi:CubicO group peptidase (beta-lactamase class C family)